MRLGVSHQEATVLKRTDHVVLSPYVIAYIHFSVMILQSLSFSSIYFLSSGCLTTKMP